MDALRQLVGVYDGIITTAQARGVGVPAAELRAAVKAGRLVRTGHGAYVDGPRFRDAEVAEQHILRARAITATVPDSLALSHFSAAAMWGLPLPSALPSLVHFARLERGPSRSCGSHRIHHRYPLAKTDTIHGCQVVDAAHAVVGVAATLGFEAAVTAADAALHREIATTDELVAIVDKCRRWPGIGVLRAVIPRLDGRTESPGETLTRLMLEDLGYVITSQYDVYSASNVLIGRADFALDEDNVLVERDGAVKYVDDENRRPGAALFDEKKREDALRDLGYEVVRLIWSEVRDSAVVRRKVEAAINRSRVRPQYDDLLRSRCTGVPFAV